MTETGAALARPNPLIRRRKDAAGSVRGGPKGEAVGATREWAHKSRPSWSLREALFPRPSSRGCVEGNASSPLSDAEPKFPRPLSRGCVEATMPKRCLRTSFLMVKPPGLPSSKVERSMLTAGR